LRSIDGRFDGENARKGDDAMIGKTERVVLVKGGENNWYEQAIFIVNQDAEKMPTDFVAEAERIIREHSLGYTKASSLVHNSSVVQRDVKKPNFLLHGLMILASAVIVGVLVFGLL